MSFLYFDPYCFIQPQFLHLKLSWSFGDHYRSDQKVVSSLHFIVHVYLNIVEWNITSWCFCSDLFFSIQNDLYHVGVRYRTFHTEGEKARGRTLKVTSNRDGELKYTSPSYSTNTCFFVIL